MMFWPDDLPRFFISVAQTTDVSNWTYGERLLEGLLRADVRLVPEKLGESTKYSGPDSFKEAWCTPVTISGPEGKYESIWPTIWERNSEILNSGTLQVWSKNRPNGSAGFLIFVAAYSPELNLMPFFLDTCEAFVAAGAHFHLIGKSELGPGHSRYLGGIPPAIIKNKFPNITWATYFGPQFNEFVDFEKLRNKGYLIDDLHCGHLIRYSDRIADVLDDFSNFQRWRVRLKAEFRPDFFTITDEPPLSQA